ncbi:MAG: hypothetical protein U5L11_00070 [Arhodomonas sp.]|nr:hypothetical protein [Arhodomonas sp.]
MRALIALTGRPDSTLARPADGSTHRRQRRRGGPVRWAWRRRRARTGCPGDGRRPAAVALLEARGFTRERTWPARSPGGRTGAAAAAAGSSDIVRTVPGLFPSVDTGPDALSGGTGWR